MNDRLFMRSQTQRSTVAQQHVLLGNRKTDRTKRFANGSVSIEVNLPVMIGVAMGTHCQHGPGEVELQDLYIRRAIVIWVVGRYLIHLAVRLVSAALERQRVDPTVLRYLGPPQR